MQEINLLPQKKIGFFSEEKLLFISRATAVIAVVLVASLSIIFFLLSQDPRVAQLKMQQEQTLAKLTILQSKTAKYLIIVDRIKKIEALSLKRTGFDSSLAALIQLVPTAVTVTSFSMDKTTYSLAISTDDLSLVGNMITHFVDAMNNKKVIKSLTVQGLVSNEKDGRFVLTISGTLL